MANIIANFAMIGKRESCEFRRYASVAISANLRAMEVIDGKWILRHLTGRHGEKADLAAFVGISPHKLAKIFSGDRKVQAEEIPRVMAYFGVSQDNPALSPDDYDTFLYLFQCR